MKIKFNQNNIKRAIVSAFAVGSVGISAASYANTEMRVSTTVGASCIVSIDSTMVFANYDPVSLHAENDLIKQQQIKAQCTSGASTIIGIDAGLNTAGSLAGADVANPARRMKATVEGVDSYINYNLYVDDTDVAAIWGGISTGQVHTGTGSEVNILVEGRVTAGQTAVAGVEYYDTVTVSYDLG